MIPSSPAVSTGLTFSEDSSGFEVRRDTQSLGRLARRSVWSSEFDVQSQYGSWVIRRSGFWGSKAEIIDAASQHPIATFRFTWGGKGTLAFADGQIFHMVTRGVWHPVWTVTTETDRTILQLHTREKSVELQNATVVSESRLALLVLFTLYRVRQSDEADAAASSVAS